MKNITLTTLFALLFTATAQAASLGSCEGLDSIGNLIGSPRTFAQGAIKVAYISTEEPAAAPDHLLIFVYGEEMSVFCTSVNATDEGLGFRYIDMEKLRGAYDPAKGLLLTVPVQISDENGEPGRTEKVKVRIDRKNYEPKITLEK